MDRFRVLIMAAGKGKRMGVDIPKVMVEIKGKPMITHIVDTFCDLVDEVGVIVSPDNCEMIMEELGPKVEYIIQREQRGTGDAIRSAKEWMSGFQGETIVVVGDAPFIDSKIVNDLKTIHKEKDSSLTFLTTAFESTPPYGRVVRDGNGKIIKIVEERDCDPDQFKIKEVSTSHYCFNNQKLFHYLELIDDNNAQGEYYLTDVVELMLNDGEKVESSFVENPYKLFGINSQEDLSLVLSKI